jgi:hypothetical protein
LGRGAQSRGLCEKKVTQLNKRCRFLSKESIYENIKTVLFRTALRRGHFDHKFDQCGGNQNIPGDWPGPGSHPTTITVQKGDEKWEIARNGKTKITGDLKVGAKVTIYYRMIAAEVEVKEGKAKK